MTRNVVSTLLAVGFLVGCQAQVPTATAPVDGPAQGGYHVAHLKGSSQASHGSYLAWLLDWLKRQRGRRLEVPPLPAPLLAITASLELQVKDVAWDTATVLVEAVDGSQPPTELMLFQGTDLVADDKGQLVAAGSLIPDLPPGTYTWTVSLWQGGTEGTLVGESQKDLALKDGTTDLKLTVDKVPGLGLLEVSPDSASPGGTVTLKGHGFSLVPSQNQVTLGGQPAEVLEASNTKLKVAVPALEPGSYAWWIQVGGGMVGKAGFQVTGP